MTFVESEHWYNQKYGDSITISSTPIKMVNIGMGFAIPIIYPVPLALFINKFIKNVKVGWDENGWCFL